ncbi:MAG: hypothetical protein KA521_10515 [Crocinitomicaceae bacterium]|nr:hypothetical protein [Crocinitomicaceae bacterium]
MEPSVSHFPTKVFLSGADWFLHVLENTSKKNRFDQNIIRIVLEVEDETYSNTIIERLSLHPLVHWILNVQLKKPFFFNKAYWKYSNSGNHFSVNYHELNNVSLYDLPLFQETMRVNRTPLFKCDCVTENGKVTNVILSFHHILVDGRGASLFLEELHASTSPTENDTSHYFKRPKKNITFKKHLQNILFIKYFMREQQQVQRANFELVDPKGFKINVLKFTSEETNLILQNATVKGAKFGLNQFLLAVSIQTMSELFKNKNIPGDIWLPIPYDGRKRGAKGPVISNEISFLFYAIQAASKKSISEIMQEIHDQMMQQIRKEVPLNYGVFLEMTHYIPSKLMSFLVNRASKGSLASFLYSASIEQQRDLKDKFSLSPKNMFVIPPFSAPPGITISYILYNGQLSLNLVYNENCINEFDFTELNVALRKKLFENG